jgi:predicted HAD superfamily Cof-like phosphohydrolase
MTNYEKVREFHKKFYRPLDAGTIALAPSLTDFRIALMTEEFNELKQAIADNNRVKILDGIADLLYTVYGTAAEYGFDADSAFDRVHQSNMSKEISASDAAAIAAGQPYVTGKLTKGPGFRPVDLSDLV